MHSPDIGEAEVVFFVVDRNRLEIDLPAGGSDGERGDSEHAVHISRVRLLSYVLAASSRASVDGLAHVSFDFDGPGEDEGELVDAGAEFDGELQEGEGLGGRDVRVIGCAWSGGRAHTHGGGRDVRLLGCTCTCRNGRARDGGRDFRLLGSDRPRGRARSGGCRFHGLPGSDRSRGRRARARGRGFRLLQSDRAGRRT